MGVLSQEVVAPQSVVSPMKDQTHIREQNPAEELICIDLLEELKIEQENNKPYVIDDFMGVQVIGEGSFGMVMLVKNLRNKKPFALKIQSKKFLKENELEDMVSNEMSIMSSLKHPFLNELHQTFEDEKNLYMLLEYLPGGDLFTLISTRGPILTDVDHRFYAACILCALEALHNAGIAYRDLKPENVLVDSAGYLKLVDFGFAKRVNNGRTYTPCGTPEYFSPELIKGKGYGKASDLWSLGILVYELMCGYNPFSQRGSDRVTTYKNVLHKPLKFHPLQKSRRARHFLNGLLQKREALRLGCGRDGIATAKKHCWFKGFDWNELNNMQLRAPWIPRLKSEFDCRNFDEFEPFNENIPENLHTV